MLLHFVWADQSMLLFPKSARVLYRKKYAYEVNLLLFLLHFIFQKVSIAFLRTSITL